MIAGTLNVTVPDNFWEPVRRSIMRNLYGFVPEVDSSGMPQAGPSSSSLPLSEQQGGLPTGRRPIVTYISRQKTGRRLIPEDHEALVSGLRQLESEGIMELRIPVMERLTLAEQVAEIASSTVSIVCAPSTQLLKV